MARADEDAGAARGSINQVQAQRLHLEVNETLGELGLRRVTQLATDNGGVPVDIFHESPLMPPLENKTVLDGHVLCHLLYAMQMGLPLVVHGTLSRHMLRNLDELQRCWSRWRPERYRNIDIIPDKVADVRRVQATPRAISAFSGGVDGMFTALCQRRLFPESRRFPLTDVLLVHGFDVELKNPQYFNQLEMRVRPFLDDLGLQLRTMKTNSKDWQRQHWEDSFMLELAACLHMFSDEFDYALVGGASAYDDLHLPWGSSPVADHLMSGDLMQVVHDGAGFSRTDKISDIARYPLACKVVKVCWAGDDQSTNCGHCEKCVRTMMNFLVLGHAVPECFPHGLAIRDISLMTIYNASQKAELASILNYAERRHINADWVKALKNRLKQPLTNDRHSIYRRAASRILSAIGLKAPLKKYYEQRQALKAR